VCHSLDFEMGEVGELPEGPGKGIHGSLGTFNRKLLQFDTPALQ